MSFNLFFAGWGSADADAYLRDKKVLRLCSNVNDEKVINWWKQDKLADRLFIDSGAFSVAHSDAVVDIDDYINCINSNGDIKYWAELDVIPFPILNSRTARESSNQSWLNYVYMKERVKSACVLPIYHFGEPKSGLERILNTEINGELVSYIGVGGRHGVGTKSQIKYFNEIFSIIQSSDNPNVKVHAFGITVPEILENFPFYSADSTSWLQAAINGLVLTTRLQKIKAIPTNYPIVEEETKYFGYDFSKLIDDWQLRLLYNIDVMIEWSKRYKYRGPKVFKSQKLF